jgi:hypothetical protein
LAKTWFIAARIMAVFHNHLRLFAVPENIAISNRMAGKITKPFNATPAIPSPELYLSSL